MDLYAAPWESGKPAPSLQAKHVYGTVPVEPDGSAHFCVPAERPVYFQALDGQFNEVQRMRSYVHLQPGEQLSCIGCHEHRFSAPPTPRQRLPLALRRGPSSIEPPPWAPVRSRISGWCSRSWSSIVSAAMPRGSGPAGST